MRKFSTHKPFLVLLISAFLLLQWSATHIHLAGEHNHDGGEHHQHAVTAHQHQLNNHHADTIDVANDPLAHGNNHKVVELDHVCTQFHGKPGDQVACLPLTFGDTFARKIISNPEGIIKHQNTYLAFHQYTPLHLRAPPPHI